MMGFSHPLPDKLQFSADVTYVSLGRTISPLGLDPSLAALAAGNEYYATAQLISTNVCNDGDMYIGAFHYAQQETNTQYVVDFNTRYPIINELILAPPLRLDCSMFSGADLRKYTMMPSLLIDYNWSPISHLKPRLAQWTRAVQPAIKTIDTELFATVGFALHF